MSGPKVVDANVWTYAHDPTAGRNGDMAGGAIIDLWNMETGVLSTQVLQELFVSLTQKNPLPIDGSKARTILEYLCAWGVVVNDEQLVLTAIDLKTKYTLSFWDSLIFEAARRSGAIPLYSGDLSNGQQVGGLTMVNLFEN